MTRLPSLDTLAAPLFVLLWSTGFIGAKFGLPYAEPQTFLALRFALVVPVLALWVWLAGAPLPDRRQTAEAAAIGVLLHSVYLGGVFQAIDWGVEAGMAALITALQPIATALIAMALLGERVTPLQWTGMALGLGGVALVVARKLSAGIGDPYGVALCLVSVLSISVASILQKRWAEGHPRRSTAVVQFAAAFVVTGCLSLALESQRIVWTGEFVFALAWLVLVLSVGAISLLLLLLRLGAAANVASLFFLVPASTTLIAWAMFGETLGLPGIAGIAMTSVGVLMVNRPELFRGNA